MGLTLDVRSAVGDFDRYDQKTQQRFGRTLLTTAMLVESTQKAILRNRVKKWTGRLASTISISKGDRFTRLVGPDVARAAYAAWIEWGGGKFKGYHYVRDSVKKHRKGFINRLKKDIERP